MANWSQNEEVYKLFLVGIQGELATLGLIGAATSKTEVERMVEYAMIEFSTGDMPDLSSYNDVVTALQAFKAWAVNFRGPKPPVMLTTISCDISFPFGKTDVKFSASGMPDENEALSVAYEYLFNKLSIAVDLFVREHKLPQNTSSDTQQPRYADQNASTQSSNGSEMIEITALRVELKSNKKYVRALGGKWTKFGIAVWPEMLEKAGVNSDSLQIGDNPFNAIAKVQMKDGKPEKVLELIRR